MAETFDPYHRWLGIPPEEQPANCYRLLGIRVFEGDADVIENAADQRLAHLRNLQAGQSAEVCARLLNEVSTAKICLLNPEKKAAYDDQLRQKLAPRAIPVVSRPVPTRVPPPLPGPSPQVDPGLARLFGTTGTGSAVTSDVAARASARRRSNPLMIVGSLGIAVLMVVAAVLVLRTIQEKPSRDARLVFQWPERQREGLTVKIDDVEIEVPSSGPWEHVCPPGKHSIVASLAGAALPEQIVTVMAGERCTIEMPSDLPGDHGGKAIAKPLPPREKPPHGELAANEWADLLKWSDPERDRVEGSWKREGKQLGVTPTGGGASMMLPVHVEGAYDFTAEFAAPPGATYADKAAAVFVLPVGSSQVNVLLGGKAPLLQWVNGAETPSSSPPSQYAPLHPGGRYRVQASVRPASDKSMVLVLLNGKPCLSWQGKESELAGWKLPDPKRPAIGAWNSHLVFERVRIRAAHNGRITWVFAGETPTSRPTPGPSEGPKDGKLVGIVKPPDEKPKPPDEKPKPPDERPKPPDEKPKPPDEKPTLRLPVPAEEQQKKLLAQLNEIYKINDAQTAQQRLKLAGELFELSKESRDRPDERFVVLRTAAQLAADGGDNALATRILQTLAADFEFNALEFQAEALERRAAAAADAASIRALVEAANGVIDQALEAGRYDLAAKLAETTYRVCQKPQGKDLRKPAMERSQQIQAVLQAWRQWQDALTTLKTSPDDPQANLAAGRWYCENMNDWEKGLPHLAKGSDAKLKALAAGDLAAAPEDAAAKVKLGDAWWDAAQTADEGSKRLPFRRARSWYKQASSGEISSLTAMKVNKRLEEVAAILEPAGEGPGARPATIDRFEPGKWVDLLPHVDVGQDRVHGEWQRVRDDVTVAAGDHARLALPVHLQGSYDLEVDFSRTAGDDAVAVVFPVGGRQIAVVLSVAGGKCSGMEMLDGRRADSPRNASMRKPGILQNGRRITLLIGVRVKEDKAVIDVVLNGKAYMKTFGAMDLLSLPSHWDLNDASRPGLAANKSGVKFIRAKLRLVDGTATLVERK